MKGKLFVVSAPSGAGKNTLLSAMFERFGREIPLKHVITYTSRAPRHAEKHGIDYHFVPHLEFKQRIAQGFFLEWSDAYGSYYGSPASVIEDIQKGISVVLIVDRVGAQCIKVLVPDAILIWITVSDLEMLRQRLRQRGTENEAAIERRLMRAHVEIDLEKNERLYDHYIVNDIFTDACRDFTLIFTQELTLNGK